MRRTLLIAVLILGVVRLIWSHGREPGALEFWSRPEAARRLDYERYERLVTFLAERAPPAAPAVVLAPEATEFAWIRYLAYPRRIIYLPSTERPETLRSLVPAGTSFLVLPEARASGDASAALRGKLGLSQAELVTESPSDFALYEVRR